MSNLDPSIDKVGLALTPPVLDASLDLEVPRGRLQAVGGDEQPESAAGEPRRARSTATTPTGRTTIPDPRGQTPSHYVVASLEGADGNPADDYLVKDASGNWVLNDAQSAFLQRLGCTSGQRDDELCALDRGGAVRALAQRPRERPGRDHLPLRRRREHVAQERRCDALDEQLGLGPAARARWASRRRRTSSRAARSSTRSGTTSTAGAPRRRSAGSRIRATGTRTAATPCEMRLRRVHGDPGDGDSTPQHFYNKPNPGDLTGIFQSIAKDLSASRGRLIDNTSPSLP